MISPQQKALARRAADLRVLMEFPKRITSMQMIDGKLFVTLEDGEVIDCTGLLEGPKH